MPVYLAVSLAAGSTSLDDAVNELIDQNNRYLLQGGRGWLIRFDGTTVELSNHLQITGQPRGESSPVGSSLVVPVSGYYGRGPTDMWEWLKNRLEE